MHLRYDMMTAHITYGVTDHAQTVMSELGITYQHATPQSIADQWWFWNCENIPESLPEYLSELDINPLDIVGFGLSVSDSVIIKEKEDELCSG